MFLGFIKIILILCLILGSIFVILRRFFLMVLICVFIEDKLVISDVYSEGIINLYISIVFFFVSFNNVLIFNRMFL